MTGSRRDKPTRRRQQDVKACSNVSNEDIALKCIGIRWGMKQRARSSRCLESGPIAICREEERARVHVFLEK